MIHLGERGPSLFSCVFIVGNLLTSPVDAAENQTPWPQFHGPRRDNRSEETGLLEQWPDGGPTRLWTAQGIGHGYATLAVVGGFIYTSGNIDGKTVITAMGLDGRIRWQAPNGAAWTGSQPGGRGTPTIDGDRLYHESPGGDVACLDAKTGKKLWGLNILERFHAPNITWALSESLLIDGDRVICSPGGPESALAALEKRTGQVVWKSPSAGDLAGYASPSLGEYRGLRMIFTLTSRAIIAVNADNGDLLWRVEHATPFDEMIMMPIYRDGHVFVSTRTTGSVLLALRVEGKKCTVREVWRSKNLDNQHGGVILLDGCLYGSGHVNNHGKWVSLDWKTGRELYVEKGIGKGSLTYADGMFTMMNERGDVGLVRATPERYQLVSQFRLPAGGEGPTWAHPVIAGGRLYIRHDNLLHAFDVRGSGGGPSASRPWWRRCGTSRCRRPSAGWIWPIGPRTTRQDEVLHTRNWTPDLDRGRYRTGGYHASNTFSTSSP